MGSYETIFFDVKQEDIRIQSISY